MIERNKLVFKEKIIPLLLMLFGLYLIYNSIDSFINSIDLYKVFREQRDSNIKYGFYQWLPFFEFATSIFGFLCGLVLIKRFNIFFKALILFSLTFAIQHILNSIFTKLYYLAMGVIVIPDFRILEIGGILFFAILIPHYYEYNWKKEIKHFGIVKIIISVIVLFGIKLLLINC